MIRFKPNFETVDRVPGQVSVETLEQEQGVYSATPDFVREHCGPVANALLDRIPAWYFREAICKGLYPNIDVRIHRLYPGNFPAYPGWHCDGQFRETYFSQPDADRTQVGQHIICSLSSCENQVSNTEFLCDEVSLEECDWAELDRKIESRSVKTVYTVKDGEMMLFDSWTPHRATACQTRGWRLFFRIAMWYRPNLGEGKLCKQEQVYVQVKGW